MRKKVLQTIKLWDLVPGLPNIVVGLSGGADSVALLHILISLQAELGIEKIFAVHINHGLRPEAVGDEKFVQDLCRALQIPLKIYRADVRGLAEKESLSMETAGRKLRYFYFNETCAAFDVPNAKIATGHHQNDNAETVIMNLVRGAGLRGLCGIPVSTGRIIRPLHDVSRKEIEQYIADNALEYITDASNFSHDYTRNRIRHTVLPAIEAAVNPNVIQTIAKNTAWLRDDEDYLESIAAQAFTDCAAEKSQSAVSLNTEKLAALPLAISRRVIRMAVTHIQTHLSNITGTHIQAVLDLLPMKSGKEIHLPGLTAYKEYAHIVISVPAAPAKFGTYPLHIPSTQYIPEMGMTVSISHTKPDKFYPPDAKKPILYCTKAFEYGMVIDKLVLRTRRPGDCIIMKGAKPFTKKLQDYFSDAKTPRHQRDTIPVLASGSDVLWVLDEKSPVSAKYSPDFGVEKYENPVWVSLWRDADD